MERELTLLAAHGMAWEQHKPNLTTTTTETAAASGVDAYSTSSGDAANNVAPRRLAFDVALVSCGAWGPLVQAFLKQQLGASSVYLGGALQLHFGIWGQRWRHQGSGSGNVAGRSAACGGRSGGGGAGITDAGCFATDAWAWPSAAEAALLKKNAGGASRAGGYTES
jgi:hypothetical protein